MTCHVVITDAAAKDMQLICDYFWANQQDARIDGFLEQIEKTSERIAENPEIGSWPLELLELGIRDYREVFSHPYRIVYHCIDNVAYVLLIADARRDLDVLLQMRLFM